MSFFKNFATTVNSARFSAPNNILLNKVWGAHVLLVRSNEPVVDHINTLKALHRTLNKIKAHEEGNYKPLVSKELRYLNAAARDYAINCRKYVENGGHLTAQGIANLYACASQLDVNSQWLEKYVQDEIPHFVRYMSVENLQDVAAGLKNHQSSSKYLALVEEELKSRNREPIEYVNRAFFETAIFEETPEISPNILLNVIGRNASPVEVYARKYLQFAHDWYNSYAKRPHGYILDA